MNNLDLIKNRIGRDLLVAPKVEVPTWQSLDVRDKPQGTTIELEDVSVKIQLPESIDELQDLVKPSAPWAEKQFAERVSGEPLNPGETYKEWPWYKGNVETHKLKGEFSHTYMERYYPKIANRRKDTANNLRWGVRYPYGDLLDVIKLLMREPKTRQAYLPVWFPEDTGAAHGERVPCSLGYLFMLRRQELSIIYYIRSCDFIRHFADDIYMTSRLVYHVLEEIRENDPDNEAWKYVTPGKMTIHIGSLHVFEGDLPKLRREYGTPE